MRLGLRFDSASADFAPLATIPLPLTTLGAAVVPDFFRSGSALLSGSAFLSSWGDPSITASGGVNGDDELDDFDEDDFDDDFDDDFEEEWEDDGDDEDDDFDVNPGQQKDN